MTVAVTAMLILPAASAGAQHVSIDLRAGNVTLVATNVTLDEILAEWSKVGSLKVVSPRGEAIGGARVTMVLRDMTERQALETLLRGLSGYVVSARRDPSTGSSAFEQILILPTSAPAASIGAGAAARVRPLAQPPAPGVIIRTDGSRATSIGADEETSAGLPDTESASIAAESSAEVPGDPAPPPTPLLPPPTTPDANNPFGRAAGSSRPGVVAPPPALPSGVVYPPVTNPNAADGFKPAGTP